MPGYMRKDLSRRSQALQAAARQNQGSHGLSLHHTPNRAARSVSTFTATSSGTSSSSTSTTSTTRSKPRSKPRSRSRSRGSASKSTSTSKSSYLRPRIRTMRKRSKTPSGSRHHKTPSRALRRHTNMSVQHSRTCRHGQCPPSVRVRVLPQPQPPHHRTMHRMAGAAKPQTLSRSVQTQTNTEPLPYATVTHHAGTAVTTDTPAPMVSTKRRHDRQEKKRHGKDKDKTKDKTKDKDKDKDKHRHHSRTASSAPPLQAHPIKHKSAVDTKSVTPKKSDTLPGVLMKTAGQIGVEVFHKLISANAPKAGLLPQPSARMAGGAAPSDSPDSNHHAPITTQTVKTSLIDLVSTAISQQLTRSVY